MVGLGDLLPVHLDDDVALPHAGLVAGPARPHRLDPTWLVSTEGQTVAWRGRELGLSEHY